VAERLGNEVIEFHNVSKSFGDRLLIDNLSFKVPAGAIVGIIGPNGAGKSTLFRMIQGKEKPDSGEVLIGKTAQMAFVDQSRDSLAADKTVWEDVSGGLDNIVVGKFVMPSRAYLGRFNFKGNDQQKLVGSCRAVSAAACTWPRPWPGRQRADAGRTVERPRRGNPARAGRGAAGVRRQRPWSSATTAGSWTASAPTSWPAEGDSQWTSSTATTRNTKPTRRSAWAKKAPSPSACASRH
jgi:ABC-type dipeptide/oligopeptide/nickel transport system ATPase subunit